ncbi:uncharacterized protein LOC123009010 [Tribolium madens]|uniref:uncharacterized protein LOC123009010 n=1 Tax=Tribolium madens TaxID=41895 RepID=UPI001CF75FFF|nr:uncharacterized protein LOC123009010 [Tribolium madens]
MDSFGNYTTTTSTGAPDVAPHRDYKFLIVPLVVVFLILLLSALVYLMARRKRRLDRLRHSLMVLYEFDSNEHEWESLNSSDNPNYTQINNTAV